MRTFVRHIKSDVIYEFLGGNTFKNLITGVEGEVPDEKAREIFKINAEATLFINEFPLVEQLVKRLNLRVYAEK